MAKPTTPKSEGSSRRAKTMLRTNCSRVVAPTLIPDHMLPEATLPPTPPSTASAGT